MSTKTSIKRIALVAVSALGFGLLSVMPAKAEAAVDEIAGLSVVQNGNRAGIASMLYVTAIPNASTDGNESVTVEAVVVAKPTGSTVALNDVTATTCNTTSDEILNVGGTSGVFTSAECEFTPDLAGSYRILLWHDAGGLGVRDAGEKAVTSTVVVVAEDSPITATLTVKNSTSVEDGNYGVAATVTIKNSNGVVTRLGDNEQLSITANSATVTVESSTDTNGLAEALDSTLTGFGDALTQANFSKGIAYLNILNSEAESSKVLTLAGESGFASAAIKKTASLTWKAEGADTVGTCALDNSGDGAYSATPAGLATFSAQIPEKTASALADFSCVGGTEDEYTLVQVEDASGTIFGPALSWGYDHAALNDEDGEIAFSLGFYGVEALTNFVDPVNANALSTLTITVEAESWVLEPLKPTAQALAPLNGTSSYKLVDGGTVSVTMALEDEFGSAFANELISVDTTGRNAKSTTLLTDASGLISYAITDTAGATSATSSDSVVFGSGEAYEATISVSYVSTFGVSTVTLAYPGDADTVAGTTSTDISAAAGGATGSSASIVATVKDENGSVVTGVPVTFAVAGLTGAEVHTDTVTAYTDAIGKATGKVSSYAAGKATVTVTSGGKSATADIYFKQETDTDARTITATASNGIVTATVTDRYGNPIKDVTVKATRAGTGFFGSGSSSATGDTDKNGVVDFYFNGSGTVTVGFDGDEFGQSADAAGKVGTTAVTASAAGTALVAQKGLGASLAPAGVNSVTLSVEGTSAAQTSADAAADAAAEAIDAANAATDAANLAAEAADAATVAAEEARDAADAATAAVEELATQVATLMAALKAQITTLANTVAKIAKKVKA